MFYVFGENDMRREYLSNLTSWPIWSFLGWPKTFIQTLGGCICSLWRAEPAGFRGGGPGWALCGLAEKSHPCAEEGQRQKVCKGGIRGEYAAARWEFENETESRCLNFLTSAKSTRVWTLNPLLLWLCGLVGLVWVFGGVQKNNYTFAMIIYNSQLRFIGINIMVLLDQWDPIPDSNNFTI